MPAAARRRAGCRRIGCKTGPRRRAGCRRIGCKTGPRSPAVRSSLDCNPAGRKRCWGHTPGLPADRTTAAQIGQAGTAGHTDRTGCTMRRSDHIPEQRAWPAEPAGYRREPYRMPGPESPADRMTAERSGPTVRSECMRRSSDRMRGFPAATPDGSSAHRSVVECTVGCSRPGLRYPTLDC